MNYNELVDEARQRLRERIANGTIDKANYAQYGFNRYRVNRGEKPLSIYLGDGVWLGPDPETTSAVAGINSVCC